jgi:hypothetical protein
VGILDLVFLKTIPDTLCPVYTSHQFLKNSFEHQTDTLNGCAKAGNIDCVRNTFHNYEKQDPNLQNIAACYNASQLIAILKSDCGYDTWVRIPRKYTRAISVKDESQGSWIFASPSTNHAHRAR